MTASWIRPLAFSTLVLGLLNSAFAADSPLVATDAKQVDRDYFSNSMAVAMVSDMVRTLSITK